MTTGVQGTGPYGELRLLNNNIAAYRYEISLVEIGMKRPLSRKRLEQLIVRDRKRIREIRKMLAGKH